MRLESEMSSRSMILRARTRPTPGSDSSTVETFIFPTTSSLVRSRSSFSVVRPLFSCSLSSARFCGRRRPSGASFLCSSLRGGGKGIGRPPCGASLEIGD